MKFPKFIFISLCTIFQWTFNKNLFFFCIFHVYFSSGKILQFKILYNFPNKRISTDVVFWENRQRTREIEKNMPQFETFNSSNKFIHYGFGAKI